MDTCIFFFSAAAQEMPGFMARHLPPCKITAKRSAKIPRRRRHPSGECLDTHQLGLPRRGVLPVPEPAVLGGDGLVPGRRRRKVIRCCGLPCMRTRKTVQIGQSDSDRFTKTLAASYMHKYTQSPNIV